MAVPPATSSRPPASADSLVGKLSSMADTDHSPEMPPSPDSERVAQFVELYSKHYPRLQYYLMSLVPTQSDAADVIQETSLVLWKKFDTFEIGTNFFAWACKIARFQAMKHYQQSGRSARAFDPSTLDILADEAVEHAVETGAPMEVLESCLQRLSEADRTLILRRYQPDSTVNQIAAELEVTANFLSKSIGRIRRALLTCMESKLAQE